MAWCQDFWVAIFTVMGWNRKTLVALCSNIQALASYSQIANECNVVAHGFVLMKHGGCAAAEAEALAVVITLLQ